MDVSAFLTSLPLPFEAAVRRAAELGFRWVDVVAFAGQRMVQLCVEHIPGRALPDVTAVLNWLDRVGHANLALLLDLGHCLISNEDPAGAVRQAGARLGYVHVDDNDGKGDLHWPLL